MSRIALTSTPLRAKLRRQFLWLGLLPVLGFFAASCALLLPHLVEQAETQNGELAHAVQGRAQLHLALRQQVAAMLAERLSTDTPAPGAVRRSLQAAVHRDPFLHSAFATNARDEVVEAALAAKSGRWAEDVIGLDMSRQAHVAEARRRGEPVWSDSFLSTLTGEITAGLAYPAGEQMVLLEFSLSALSDSLAQAELNRVSDVIVVDRVGRVIVHPSAAMALQQQSLSGVPLVQQALLGKSGSAWQSRDGTRELAHALPIRGAGWVVIVSQPASAVLAPLLGLAWVMLGMLVLAGVLAVVAGRTLARRTGREMQWLAQGVEDLVTTGKEAPALSFSIREFSAIWGRLHDLLLQLNQRDELTRTTQQDLQAVLDASTQFAIIATDSQGLVTTFNAGAERLLGWTSSDIVGKYSPALWHDEAEVAAHAATLSHRYGRKIVGFGAFVEEARRGGFEARNWTYVRRDGSRVEVSLTVTAVRLPDGSLKGYLGIANDISEQRRMEALEVARRTAELANRAKSEFLARMSHELRTPLNAILGFAELMEEDEAQRAGTGQHGHARHIQAAGWHLVRLIDDVLDLARIESGRLGIEMRPVVLRPLCASLEKLMQSQMDKAGVRFSVAFDTPGDAPLLVMADEARLTQVLMNLLGNAAKYNRRGGAVELLCRRDGAQVRLSVADTGLGMCADQLAHLYEPFNRLGQESSTVQGTGIGLVITRQLVELMGGRIEVQSEPGRGTQFVVTLQAHDGLAPIQERRVTMNTHSLHTAVGGRVAYVEDDATNALLMQSAMRQRPNIELRVHARALEALEAIRADPPDLILLDLHLPDACGEQVLEQLQADACTRGIPVVVLSADATGDRANDLRALGACAYLTKPLVLAEVLNLLDRLLAPPVVPIDSDELGG